MKIKALAFILILTSISFSQIALSGDNYSLRYIDGKKITFNDFELQAIQAVIADIQAQNNGKTYYNKLEFVTEYNQDAHIERKAYSGRVQISNDTYEYHAIKGLIHLISKNIKEQSTINAHKILTAIALESKNERSSKRSDIGKPLLPYIGVVVALQGTCTLTEIATAKTCEDSCQCGVADYSTSCILGFRTSSCSCQPCPIDPLSLYYHYSNTSILIPAIPVGSILEAEGLISGWLDPK